MRHHLEFIAGITILFFMAVVLWKFIEPKPMGEVVSTLPLSQMDEQIGLGGNSSEEGSPIVPVTPAEDTGESAPMGSAPTEDIEEPVACTMDAMMCPDGSYVGRVAPNCEFAPCPSEDNTSSIMCPVESRNVDACISVVEPVCGLVQVECITTPCDPVQQTFGNSCEACSNERVISYTESACESGEDLAPR